MRNTLLSLSLVLCISTNVAFAPSARADEPVAQSTTETPEAAPSRHRNPKAHLAGIVLTSIGAGLLAAGTIITIRDELRPVPADGTISAPGVVALDVGVPLMIASTAFAGAGIPLWVWGGGTDRDKIPSALSVGMGPGAASLHLSF